MLVAFLGSMQPIFSHQSGNILVLQNKKNLHKIVEIFSFKIIKNATRVAVFLREIVQFYYIFSRRSISSLTYLCSKTETNTKCNKLAKNTKESVVVADSYQPAALQIQSVICGNKLKNVQ